MRVRNDGSTQSRSRLLIGFSAGIVGLLIGAMGLFGGSAGAVVSTWTDGLAPDPDPMDTTVPQWSSINDGEGFTRVQYGKDAEGIVHLRGVIKANDATMFQPAGPSGPTIGTAYTLPCGYRPPGQLIQTIGVMKQDLSAQLQGLLWISTTGEVSVGGFDLDTTTVDDVITATFFASTDSITFTPVDEVCE